MGNSVPIVMIAIAVILVALALIALRAWTNKGGKSEHPITKNKKAFFAQFIVGLCAALAGAFFMIDGDIFGENTTGIATIVGIVGISLIGTSNVTLLGFNRRR